MRQLKRILLVEDNPKDIELVLAALEDYKLANQVDVTQGGQEATDYLTHAGPHSARPNGNPAVVLLDLKLPKIDGPEVLKRIRDAGPLKNLPVVMLTSSRDDRDVARAYDVGVNAYGVKPLDFEQFLAAVRELGVFREVVNEPPPRTMR